MKTESKSIKRAGLERSQKGFTLVETLVAIAILMIAIAGPLVVANQGLVAALYAKDQSIASLLAQEGMELVRNVKDNSTDANPDTGFSDTFLSGTAVFKNCIGNDSSGKPNNCGIFINDSGIISYRDGQSSYPLYQENALGNFAYTHLGPEYGNVLTIFTREFNVVSISANEVKVTVTVTWKEGTVDNNVSITSEMVSNIL